MAVTMQQVAELAGVSRGTVDRVMHGRPNVNPMVREKVLRAAEKLGYTCKKAAAAPTHRAAILIPQWTDTYFNRQVISGIRRALRYIADNSFELVEVPLRTMTSQELVGAIEQQVQDGVDGLIIRAENTPEVRAAIEQAVQGLYKGQNEESFWTLMSALNYALELETHVLVPLQTALSAQGAPAPWMEHPIPAEKADGLALWTLRNDKGRCWLPLFTSVAAAGADRSTGSRPMADRTLEQAMQLALEFYL